MNPYETRLTEQAAAIFGVRPELIAGPSRIRQAVLARQAVMVALMRGGYTTTTAAAVVNRDHATAVHARKTIEDLCVVYPDFKRTIDQVLESDKQDTANELRDQYTAETGRSYAASYFSYIKWLEKKLLTAGGSKGNV